MIVIAPMAGGDAPFEKQGYPHCKWLVEVGGKPLIEHVWNNLRCLGGDRYVFLIRKEDALRYHLAEVLKLLDPRAIVLQTEAPTAGAACTVLLGIEHIALDEELVVTNGDQLILADLAEAVGAFRARKLDGGTIVFDSVHPRWSFVLTDDEGLVIEAAEKRPISRTATAGFYYFRTGAMFVEGARSMIRKDAHVNGQFYVCPVFNEMILRQAAIGVYPIDRSKYLSLATPQNVEEYERYLAAEQKERLP
jgi:NDP-sugar pyrophosphorylase family protein